MSPYTPPAINDGVGGGTPMTAANIKSWLSSVATYADQQIAGGIVAGGAAFKGYVPVVALTTENPTIPIKAALRRGYSFVTASELAAGFRAETTLPSKPALLTYDMGRQEVFTVAHPVVVSYGIKATLFVTSDFLYGQPVDPSVTGTAMTWDNARAMYATGRWDFQNGTKTHAATDVTNPATNGIVPCSNAIVTELGAPTPVAIAYPNGNYDGPSVANLAAAGFKAGFDIETGGKQGTGRFTHSDETDFTINRTVKTAADWLDSAWDDIFFHWDWDTLTHGRNSGNGLSYWSSAAPTVFTMDSNGEDLKIDGTQGIGNARSVISNDYFRVRPNDRIYVKLWSSAESLTAGQAQIRIAQYDWTKTRLPDMVVQSYTSSSSYAVSEVVYTLASNCDFIRFEMALTSNANGILHTRNLVVRREPTLY